MSDQCRVFQWAISALHFIDADAVVFISVCDVLIYFYRVLSTEVYFYLRVFKQRGYLPYFFAAIRKSGRFLSYGALSLCVYYAFVVVVMVFQLGLRCISFSVVCF
jgi:hypothetical protein